MNLADAFSLTASQQTLLDQPVGSRLFLEGPAGTGKTTAAVVWLERWLASGAAGDSLLVLAPQRTLLAPYDLVLRQQGIPAGGMPTLLTVGGLAQRMGGLFWPSVSGLFGFGQPHAPPTFLTLETAQYYMAHIVQPFLDERRLFDSVTLERNRLFSQILDNLNKAAVVGFSYLEIGERLKAAWVGDPGQLRVYEDVQFCANLFRQFCLQHNLLDYSLQLELFCTAIWPQEACRRYLFQSFRHLIFENVEEDMPVAHDLLRLWLPDFTSALLIYDSQAGYRRFLGADPDSAYQLRALCDRSLSFTDNLVSSPAIQAFSSDLAAALFPTAALTGQPLAAQSGEVASYKLLSLTGSPLPAAENSEPPDASLARQPNLIRLKSSRFFPQLLDWATDTIADLIQGQGIPPDEIVVLSPYLSDSLRFSLAERLAEHGIAARSHRPSRSLRDEPATQCLLTLAALAHPEWGVCPSRFDVAYALVQAIQELDLVRSQLLSEIVYRTKNDLPVLTSFDNLIPEVQERITYRLGERFERLRLWLEQARESGEELDHFLSRLFGELLSQPGFGFHTRYDAGQTAANLIESVQKFRWVAGSLLAEERIPLGQEYLKMVQAGVIAAQYLGGWRLENAEAVLLAPAYTFLMMNRPVAVQFWLDAGNRSWAERLYQPLTHPYVLSRNWQPGRAWTDADELETGRAALLRLATGLLRRCKSSLYLGLTDLNEQGYEQRGSLLSAIQRIFREAAK